jgi:hypothetical protein
MALLRPCRGPPYGGHVPGRLACQLRGFYRSLEIAPTARIGSRTPEGAPGLITEWLESDSGCLLVGPGRRSVARRNGAFEAYEVG